MTRKHFEYAAALVREILQTGEFPDIEVVELWNQRGNINVAEFVAR